VRIEHSFVRPEDEPALCPWPPKPGRRHGRCRFCPAGWPTENGPEVVALSTSEEAEPDGAGLLDRLLLELTAHRTAGLRDALAQAPERWGMFRRASGRVAGGVSSGNARRAGAGARRW
jgi:ParB family chromosome partitioning protein